MSILNLLKGNIPLVHPTCIFLDDSKEAHWLLANEIDRSKIKWQSTVNWKDIGCDILIATSCNPEPRYEEEERTHISANMSYLKSHLQKCIRRSNANKAIKTAVHYYSLDCVDFLRRLAIIAIEDSLPLDGYCTLIWYLVASSNGYHMSAVDVCWVLGYVYDLCQCPYYEQFKVDNEIQMRNMKLRSLNTHGRDLCYSIMLRQAYGGMKGDKAMCIAAAQIWSGRSRVNGEHLKLLKRDPIFISFPEDCLKPDEWIVAAIDFHCYPGIVLNLAEKHDEFSQEEIKDAIWHCSSSCTNKANISMDLLQRNKDSIKHNKVWKAIKKDFLSLAKFMIHLEK